MRIAMFTADAWRSVAIILIGTLLLYAMVNHKLKAQTALVGILVLCLIDLWTVDKRYLNDSHFTQKTNVAQFFTKTPTDEYILSDTTKPVSYTHLDVYKRQFRINAPNTGQFERTLIIADNDSYVSYLEGCTAPMRDENQLHAAVVEIIALENAEVKYSTVQNWYPGDKEGKGGVYNFVTKRGICKGNNSKISWTQVETGSAITWKYPSCILARCV